MRVWLIVWILPCQVAALGQQTEQAEQQPGQARRQRISALREKALELIRVTQELADWDRHYGYMLDATERVFERNGWDSESDLFSLEMFREVGQIPPWKPMARFDKALEMIGDRYLLDGEQMASLQSRVIQTNVRLFSRHSDRIMQYAVEVIQARAAGEPFTPEQVARWTTLAEPVFQDARRSINATAREFMNELDPEQRELLERDLAAANRRMSDIERMAQKWKRGDWDPHDWGMEQDPIQNPDAVARTASALARARANAEHPARPAEPGPADHDRAKPRRGEQTRPSEKPKDDDAWAEYVRAFIRKYHLNDEQQQRAWLIYRDAKQRNELFERRYKRQMEALHGKAGDPDDESKRAALRERTEQRRAESERLFRQLRRRLDRLPTRAQRKNAEPGEMRAPASPAKEAKPKKAPE